MSFISLSYGLVQFVVFEKIYKCLFIPKCTRKIRHGKPEEMHAYHAIREKLRHKLRHPRRALDLKTKDLIGSDQTLMFISQS